MANTSNIPTGLNVPSQIPLDTITYSLNEFTLSNLGTDNNLAFKYYKNLIVNCIEENTNWIWREVQEGEENTGLLNIDYEYPYNHIVNNVNYSNKKYNFFKINNYEELLKNSIISIGNKYSLYKGFNEINDKHEFYTINSNTLKINIENNVLSLDLPESSQIPALYVNNLYIPSYSEWVNAGGNLVSNPSFKYKGEGTLSKPFTDSINYTSSTSYTIDNNTSIQNALDAYVGDTGIYSRLNPEKSGQQIIIQKNNTIYTFTGDFNYSSLNLLIQGYVVCTTTGWLVNMDNPLYFDSNSSFITIRVDDEGILQLTDSLGFKNSGNTSSTFPSFDTGRIGYLLGNGEIYSSYNGVDVLNRYIINSDGNFNDLNLHFQVKCRLRADYQGIYLAKNYARYDFYNTIQSGMYLGSVNINLQAFRMTGGLVRFYENGAITISSQTSSRTYGITFEPENDGIGYCRFELNSAKIGYTCKYLFSKLNDENVEFLAFNSVGVGSTTFPLGSNLIINGLFENAGFTPWNVEFRNCVYQFTGIDHNRVDLTNGNLISSVNTIGSNVIETLVVYNNRANAIAAGVPLYSAFLNRGNSGTPEGDEINNFPLTGKWYKDIVLPN